MLFRSKNSTPEFGQGAAGFGRYYWHSFADQADENLWVEFLLPVVTRQDPRYYTLGRRTANRHNGPLKRAGYAVSRLFITRTDSGGNTFNVSRSAELEQPPPYPIFTIPVPSEPGLRPISDGY